MVVEKVGKTATMGCPRVQQEGKFDDKCFYGCIERWNSNGGGSDDGWRMTRVEETYEYRC